MCRALQIASEAVPGEILICKAAFSAARLKFENIERRELELKGKSEPIDVYVLRVAHHELT